MVQKLNSGVKYPGHGVGLRNVGSYQISGHPFITGSTVGAGAEVRVSFPFVTKTVTVFASGTNPIIGVAFNSGTAGNVNGGNHYLQLSGDGTNYTFDVKCKEIYVHGRAATSGFKLYASLTGIGHEHMYHLTGSGLTD